MQQFYTLDRLGSSLDIPVRYSNRAKHIAIKIKREQRKAELVLPNKNYERKGYQFLLKKESWIRQKLDALTEITVSDKVIPYFGEMHHLHHIESEENSIIIKDGAIHLHTFSFRKQYALTRFLRSKLLEEVVNISSLLRHAHNIHFSAIKIRDNKTRWGSCNSKAIISFNWRLVFAPRKILEYVVAHEMSHIIEMNHSQRFWDLVEKLCPEYKSSRKWLKEHGHRLHLYLA